MGVDDWISKHRAKPGKIATRVAIQALDFHTAALRAYENGPLGDTASRPLPIVGLVNASFACECYLKALAIRDAEKAPRDHNLTRLFAEIAPRTRDELSGLFRGPGTLGDALEHFATAFSDWRYIYEEPYGVRDPRPLLEAASALLRVCEPSLIRPLWPGSERAAADLEVAVQYRHFDFAFQFPLA